MKATLLNHKIQLTPETFEVGNSFGMRIKENNPILVGWVHARLSKHRKPTLIDVGAHTGQFTLLAALLPKLRVFAFEPVFSNVLALNVIANKVKGRVKIFECALGAKVGEGIIHIAPRNIGSHSTMSDDVPPLFGDDWQDKHVFVDTLDAVCQTHDIRPTLIKIDTEGMDKMVIEGGEKTIRKYKPDILVEYNAEHAARFDYGPSQITKLLHSWGYACKVRRNDAACVYGADKNKIW